MKRMIFCLALCWTMSVSVLGATSYVVDQADLLTAAEQSALEAILQGQAMDVVVMTTPDLGGKDITAYADDYYDDNGYGQGTEASGLLLLLDMGQSQWAISTHGEAFDAFSTATQNAIMDQVVPYLSQGAFYQGFETFAVGCEEAVAHYQAGTTYQGEAESLQLGAVLICFAIGALVAGLVVWGFYGDLRSVQFQASARAYVKDGSVCVNQRRDLFLGSNVTRVRIQKEPEHGAHHASSGRSHGGSRGRF